MGRAKDAVGRYGEQVAVDYLVAQGMHLLDRNWRCTAGEIDAILRDGDALVFVEVKTRRSNAFGTPAEAVGWAKRARLRTTRGDLARRVAGAGTGDPLRPRQRAAAAGRGGRVDHVRSAF